MRPLIVLGASVRAAAFSAIRAGFAPYAIDLFADRDLAAACPAVKIARYPGEFLRALAAAPDAPWIYTGGLENHPRLVDRLAEVRPLLGNRGGVLRRVRDPVRLANVVRSVGLLFPRVGSPADGAEIPGNWLVKPRRASGGLMIRVAKAADFANPPRGTYWQEYVEGEAASAVFVAAGGRTLFLGATRQLLGRDFAIAPPFLYAGSMGPLALCERELAQLQTLGDALAGEFGLVGLFNVDFVRTNQAIWPVEVNPRYSASMEVLERSLGIDCVAGHVAACEGRTFVADTSAGETLVPHACGKAVVYAAQDAIIAEPFEELVQAWNRPGDWPVIADLPQVGERIRAGQPVATVFADGDVQEEIERELRARIAAVYATLRLPTLRV